MTLYAARVAGVRQICFWQQMPSFVVLTLPDMDIRPLSWVKFGGVTRPRHSELAEARAAAEAWSLDEVLVSQGIK